MGDYLTSQCGFICTRLLTQSIFPCFGSWGDEWRSAYMKKQRYASLLYKMLSLYICSTLWDFSWRSTYHHVYAGRWVRLIDKGAIMLSLWNNFSNDEVRVWPPNKYRGCNKSSMARTEKDKIFDREYLIGWLNLEGCRSNIASCNTATKAYACTQKEASGRLTETPDHLLQPLRIVICLLPSLQKI